MGRCTESGEAFDFENLRVINMGRRKKVGWYVRSGKHYPTHSTACQQREKHPEARGTNYSRT